MLIVTRRRNESIRIAENIIVTLLDIRGQQVRIGITAPPYTTVVRSELTQRRGKSVRKPSAKHRPHPR
jgi:carbon storage regulator